MPVLGGLHVEADPEAITLTATGRYRLSTRTLVPAEPTTTTWGATVDGDDLRTVVTEIRRSAPVGVEAAPRGVWLRMTDREDQHCRLLPEDFPDYRLMLASLPEISTRVTVPKVPLLRALEEHLGARIAVRVRDRGMDVEFGDEHPGRRLPAAATGAAVRISFELTPFYPAVSTTSAPTW